MRTSSILLALLVLAPFKGHCENSIPQKYIADKKKDKSDHHKHDDRKHHDRHHDHHHHHDKHHKHDHHDHKHGKNNHKHK